MRVLLAIDGSSCSNAAIKEVAERPWPIGTEIRIISAYEVPVAPLSEGWALPPDFYRYMEGAVQEEARALVNRAAFLLTSKHGDSASVTTEIIAGPAKHVIIDEADRWDANLIVVGSHGYRGIERFLLGSVSQAVASHAKCSVQIVRCPRT